MPKWINFAELRARISLSDVIFRYYGITTLRRDGNKLVGPCPVHNGDSPRAFHADLDKNVWHCFSGCKKGGNQLDLVCAKDGIGIREAALKLKAFFLEGEGHAAPNPAAAAPAAATARAPATPPAKGDTTKPSNTAASKPTEGSSTNAPLEFTLDLKGDHPHLVSDRQLQPETIATFGVGYCSRGILRGTIAIPIHDAEGKLVAYAGRRLKPSEIDQFGKYKLPKGFRKELVLYNFHRAKNHAGARLILVEGFFSVLKLHEAGLPNVVATMGCELSASQAELLRACREVIVLFDGNEAGWSGAEKVRELLSPSITVRIVRLPAGKEPEDLSPKGLRWLVNGLASLDLTEVALQFNRDAAAKTKK